MLVSETAYPRGEGLLIDLNQQATRIRRLTKLISFYTELRERLVFENASESRYRRFGMRGFDDLFLIDG